MPRPPLTPHYPLHLSCTQPSPGYPHCAPRASLQVQKVAIVGQIFQMGGTCTFTNNASQTGEFPLALVQLRGDSGNYFRWVSG